MSFWDCLNRMIDKGDLDPERGQKALELFDEIEAQNAQNMGDTAADVNAGQRVFDALKFQAREKKRRAAIQNQIGSQRLFEIEGYINGKGEKDPAAGFRALEERDELAGFTNLAGTHDEVLGRANSILAKVLKEYRPTITGGARNPESFRNVVHELFGKNTKDPNAKNFAKSLTQAFEYLRHRFNAAGGRIPKRKDFGMPQTHSKDRLIAAGVDEWQDFIIPRLDPTKMMDPDTGLPMTHLRLDADLSQTFDDIVTIGISRETPSDIIGKRALANKRLDHRQFVFKDSQAWLEYADRFGDGDPFSVAMRHMDSMARDIARMEVFGPNPTAMRGFLKERVMQNASLLDSKKTGRAGFLKTTNSWVAHSKTVLNQADNMHDLFTGDALSPVHDTAAAGMSGFQAFHTGAVLGSAMLSAISDIGFQRMAAGFSKLPQVKLIGNVLKTFAGMGRLERMEAAARMGLITDNMSVVANTQMRYVGEVLGPMVLRRVAHTVLNLSLLSPWTKAGRWGFGMTFYGELAKLAPKGFGKLTPEMRQTFGKYGISGGDWDLMRKTKLYDAARDVDGFKPGAGSLFMIPKMLAENVDIPRAKAMELSNKLSRMVLGETEFAVPSSTLRGRAFLLQGTKPGTSAGLLLRSVSMYKQFAATIINTHVRRALSREGAGGKGLAFANLTITTAVMGALALQLKEIAKGRDPRPMVGENGAAFWEQAILQGGGLGLWGDFILADTNRFGMSFQNQLVGPVGTFIDDVVLKGVVKNTKAAVKGEETQVSKDVVDFMRRYTPGGSLWYARLGYERLILDQLQEQIDPKFKQRVRNRERKYKRDFRQGYWWKAGKPTPQRGPGFGN
uniref:Uncharacterized protein n=1 Tax=uncultured marine virus TaxID=186617 RepID=A0A0F7L7C5_9VIRU|nr:hypothetical protein [uncultured marine virus]